jgi:hypothetical protein
MSTNPAAAVAAVAIVAARIIIDGRGVPCPVRIVVTVGVVVEAAQLIDLIFVTLSLV